MKLTQAFTLTASVALLAGCANWNERFKGAEPVAFNQMPPAAQATVRNEIGNQPITSITKEYKYGEPDYRIEVQKPGLNPTLWVASDGYIIKESRRLVNSSPVLNEAAGAQPSHSQPMTQPKNSSVTIY